MGYRGCFVYYELYMDAFFLENFCLDFLLLFLTGIAARLPVRFGRMAAWAACGSVGSCALLLLFPEGGVFLTGAAAVLALLMVKGSFQISFGQKKRLVRSTAVFLGMAFLMGGLLPVLRLWVTLPVILSGIAGTALIYAALRLKEKWKYETENLCEVTLLWNGRQKKLSGLRDTGNRLVDPYHGKPVAVVEYQAVKELFNQKTKVLWIPYHTVGKQNGCMPGICLDCLFINRDGEEKKIDRPIVAVSKETLNGAGRYQMILPSTLIDD